MRWQDSGAPFQARSCAASRSVMPGRRPRSTAPTACDVWHADHSNAASCSTSLSTRSPSSASMSRSEAFSTRPPAPTLSRSSSTRNAGASIDVRRAYVFQPTSPTRLPDPMPSSRRISGRELDSPRGWLGRLRSWKRTASHRQRGGLRHPVALVAEQDRRLLRGSDDEDRLLEPGVEPGQVGEVRAVLSVGPDHEVVVAPSVHPRPQPIQPAA